MKHIDNIVFKNYNCLNKEFSREILMKNTLKKFTVILLCAVCAMCSVFCAHSTAKKNPVHATTNDIASTAGKIAMDAVQSLFGDDKGVIGVKSVFKSVFTGIGYVNAGVAFLKLIGILKDATAEALAHIQEQLNIITDRLNVMDQKLDAIINAMSEIKARQDFIDRTTSARDYRKYFSDFKRDYCENGINPLITEFESKRTDSMKAWYNSETAAARTGDIDNSKVVLLYDLEEDGSYTLRYTLENGVPAGYEGRYLIFSEDFFPVKADLPIWNVDNYREVVESFISDKILKKFSDIASQNYPAFTPSGVWPDGLLTPELIKRTASDAVNLLIYRTTAAEINKSSSFVNTVLAKFDDYVNNLLKAENGFDAMIRALYYTHSFEYEISDTIKELFAELVFETTYYGSFVKSVAVMSNDVTQARKEAFNETYANAIISLEKIKDLALTDKPNYCYLTNTVVYYGMIELAAGAEIKTYADGPNDGYDSYSARGFGITIYRYKEDGLPVYAPTGQDYYNKNYLIGNDAATLISMTLRSNGIIANHEYFIEKLKSSVRTDDCGSLIVSLSDEADLPYDSSFPLKVKKVIGDYFTDDSIISMRNMPANTGTEYVLWHRMLQGSLFDFAKGSLSSNTIVSAIALFGEHHWYWSDDESAFMSGTSSNAITRVYNKVCTKDSGKRQYTNYYSIVNYHNCLLQEPLNLTLTGTDEVVNPLYQFRIATGYTEPSPENMSAMPTEPKTYSSDPREGSKAGYRAFIIVPSVAVVAFALGLAVYFTVGPKRKKAEK